MIVKLSFGYTHKIKDYEMIRCDIGLEDECKRVNKDEVLEDMRKYCETKVLKSIEKFVRTLERKRG